MQVLQHYTKAGWVSVGCPFGPGNSEGIQRCAQQLAPLLGVVWRVVSLSGSVLCLFDGKRWHSTAPAMPMPAPWWEQDRGQDFQDTIPTR